MSDARETDTRPLGLILAGGAGRRLGGRDKGLVELGGRTLLAHVVDRLAAQCCGLVLSANGEPDRFAEYGLPVVPDDLPDRPGPLAGIVAGLDWAAANRPDVADVVSVAVDTPFLPRDLVVRFLAAKRGEDAPVACAASGGRRHHAIALWSVESRQALRRLLVDEDVRRMETVLDRLGAVAVDWGDAPTDPFLNVNERADLDRASRSLREQLDDAAPRISSSTKPR